MHSSHAAALVRATQTLAAPPPGTSDPTALVLTELRRASGADAVALLVASPQGLVPASLLGLDARAGERPLSLAAHPRLQALSEQVGALRFAADDPRPDPWDGLLSERPQSSVHACMGHPLHDEQGSLRGLLTLDAFAPLRFAPAHDQLVGGFAALAQLAIDRARLDPGSPARAIREHPGMLGESPVMQALRREIELIAKLPTKMPSLPVLILGETGTGKELVAEAIHAASPRRAEPLIRINCATLSAGLAESELFGHRKGAFTGAHANRRGAFERAEGGTLLLDEIAELEPSLQAKLLRVLQSGEYLPVGAEREQHADVRVLAATHRDLEAEVAAGRFRADLFHRLSGYPIRVPPLRERGRDIELLAEHLRERSAAYLDRPVVGFRACARAALLAHDWPGNVRELEHRIARACLRALVRTGAGPVEVSADDLELHGRSPAPELVRAPEPSAGEVELPTLAEALDALRRDLIAQALVRSQGNWADAARQLGLDRSNLHRLGRRLGLR